MQDMKLIQKIAWSFNKTTGLPIDDLIGEASLAYAENLHTYNPGRGKITTYMYPRIQHHLIDYCKAQQKQQHEAILDDLEDEQVETDNISVSQEDRVIFKSRLKNGSEELKYLAWMIFQSPSEFLGWGGRQQIKDKLREQGWTWKQIWRTFTEVKNLLKT
jgi:DNA-directed RNA polymerase specialized sigma24 family protein